ncbi:hypothetical protein [Adhaeribacter soli]|uniref:Uncharacterized protein n=1 Tax=Adhaeribacter soli TaxID=2607655 RepID=A0A5N1IU79_9BACT|nr:hypothetical protein [Adhaeribacter soli]KAA9332666.1 hypothetical protein F0P94_11705 [Adhaeribacter soli]
MEQIFRKSPNIFLYRHEQQDELYEVEITLQPHFTSQVDFVVENSEVENVICYKVIDFYAVKIYGDAYTILAYDYIVNDGMSSYILYNYQVSIRVFEEANNSGFNELGVMDFDQFMKSQEDN